MPESRGRGGLYLLLVLLLCYGYFVYRGSQWNADSRLDLTFSMVERGTIAIDAYHENTADKAFYNGHYYTDKAIGASLLAAPLYAVLKPTIFSSAPPDASFLIRYILTFFVIAIPSAVLAVSLHSFLRKFLSGLPESNHEWPPKAKEGMCLLVAMAFALGTIAFPYATVFFGHQLAGLLLFSSFLVIYSIKDGARLSAKLSYAKLAVAGLLAGYGALTEYPAFIGVALLGLYTIHVCSPGLVAEALERTRSGFVGGSAAVETRGSAAPQKASPKTLLTIVTYCIGAAPPIAGMLIYNAAAFGHPFSQGYANLSGAPEFIAGMSQGFMGITHPSLEALWGITFSPYRGLFFLSPFLLLAFPGLWIGYHSRWRVEAVLFVGIALGYFAMNSSYYLWDGGYSIGPRHIVPALPFFVVPVILAARRWPKVTLALIVWSILMIGLATATDPLPDPALANPLLNSWLPLALSGSFNNNWGMAFGLKGFASLIPIATIIGLGLAVSWNRVFFADNVNRRGGEVVACAR